MADSDETNSEELSGNQIAAMSRPRWVGGNETFHSDESGL